VTFREIFRFELVYQARRVRTWLYGAVLFVVAYLLMRTAGPGDGVVNSPFAIAQQTVLTCMLWILMAPAVAGSAAARDAQTRMHPLVYTTPISKTDYLGGRFLAALALNALLLLAVPMGILAALIVPGMDPETVGQLRPAVYLSSYGVLALTTALTVTAVQFTLAALTRRTIVSYLGSVLFFVIVSIGAGTTINLLKMPTLGNLLDPIGFITILGIMADTWTPLQKETVLIGVDNSVLANRLLWVGLALGLLAFTHARFRLSHRAR
jgi:ABC-2 type transport system permease protein